MSFKVYPYKQGSKSAKTLAEALEGKVLKHVKSSYRPRGNDLVVNWGHSAPPAFAPAATLNRNVVDAQCKLATLKTLHAAGIDIPPFWEKRPDHPEDAKFFPIVCRTKLRGHSGDGIVIAEKHDELVAAPLYTQYIKKKDEYRVHVFQGEAFFIQRKARKLDVENPDWRVRNLAGGFVFAEVQEDDVPQPVLDNACRAADAMGLDFGGVDIIWNDKEQKAYVLEINTACGLEDRTAEKYAEVILAFARQRG